MLTNDYVGSLDHLFSIPETTSRLSQNGTCEAYSKCNNKPEITGSICPWSAPLGSPRRPVLGRKSAGLSPPGLLFVELSLLSPAHRVRGAGSTWASQPPVHQLTDGALQTKQNKPHSSPGLVQAPEPLLCVGEGDGQSALRTAGWRGVEPGRSISEGQLK